MNGTEATLWELIRWAFPYVFPAITGFAGVFAGGWLTLRRDKAQRQHDFTARQLQEFYSPLLAIRTEIRARSELRVQIHQKADEVWRKLCAEARDRGGPDALGDLENRRWPTFEKLTQYDNRQLTEQLLPEYRKMIGIFRDKFWLAEPESRAHFDALIAFMELWDRWLDKSIPAEVVQLLGHEEETLYPFYEDLESTHEELRGKLTKGEA